ncbi:MAG: hypothetical protein LC776_18710, partial [Acidobacteria bacterium]|nr:hypothetical protein [Acidobacteriota bacterium]
MRRLYSLTLNRFWLDELYEVAIVSPISKLALLLDRFDREVLDRTTGVPVPAPRIRVAGQTWQEQFMAMQSAQAAASEGAKREAAIRWEESDERAALGEVPSDVLGRLAGDAVTSNWMRRGLLRRAAGGLPSGTVGMMSGASSWFEKQGIGRTQSVFGNLIELVAGVSGWFEKRLIGRTENLFGNLIELVAGVSGWFEKRVIGRTENLFGRLTESAAGVSGW